MTIASLLSAYYVSLALPFAWRSMGHMKPIPWNTRLWKESVTQLLEFLNPLVADLGRSERRVAATRYVEGLLSVTY